MPTKTIRTLSPAQIKVLGFFPVDGKLHPFYGPINEDKSYLKTWVSLRNKGLISYDETEDLWIAHWGRLSEHLYEQVFPHSTRNTYERELKRLNELALDFSEGSNASFQRQITVVKKLREVLIKAEAIPQDKL